MDMQHGKSPSEAVARAVREVRDALVQEREGVCVDPPPRPPAAAASVLDETHLDVRLVGAEDPDGPTPNEWLEAALSVGAVLALGTVSIGVPIALVCWLGAGWSLVALVLLFVALCLYLAARP